MKSELVASVENWVREGKLLESAGRNLETWLEGGFLLPRSLESLRELVEADEAGELNDRFYQEIAFGTGGLRGRAVAARPAKAETAEDGSPEHPGVGSNMLNEYTVARATIGLYRYARRQLAEAGVQEPPKLVVAHDPRHFSRLFSELTASVWTSLGGVAFLFDGPRSTPQLSFTVRALKATCGVVVTASHNPPHDNGYKVYFADGGQIVPPRDKGIIASVNETPFEGLEAYLEIDLNRVVTLDASMDERYAANVAASLADPGVFNEVPLKAVFSPIHGTGAQATVPALRQLGLEPILVEEQLPANPNFPTVKSPNPENAEALSLAMKLADEKGADLVMATDPDADRMGVAVRDAEGELVLLTGNQIGSLMAEYRIARLKAMGWIPKEGSERAVLIKTFVTTPLQDAIATAHGVRSVNTLTGFKWIGAKLRRYEEQLVRAYFEETGIPIDYDRLSLPKRAELLGRYSAFYVFGGEESYGYLTNDTVRDKDANAACALFCEMAASLKREGKSLLDALDDLYERHGYYLETLGQLVYEGAAGSRRIARILESYREAPPERLGDQRVAKVADFGREKQADSDGEAVPAQDLFFVDLDNGYRCAARASGTEPKIKFYLFGREDVPDRARLPEVKRQTRERLEALRDAVLADAEKRAEGK